MGGRKDTGVTTTAAGATVSPPALGQHGARPGMEAPQCFYGGPVVSSDRQSPAVARAMANAGKRGTPRMFKSSTRQPVNPVTPRQPTLTFCASTSPAVKPTNEVHALTRSGCLASSLLYAAQTLYRRVARSKETHVGGGRRTVSDLTCAVAAAGSKQREERRQGGRPISTAITEKERRSPSHFACGGGALRRTGGD